MSLKVAIAIIYIVTVAASVNEEPSVEDLIFYNGKVVDARYPVYGYEHRPVYPY